MPASQQSLAIAPGASMTFRVSRGKVLGLWLGCVLLVGVSWFCKDLPPLRARVGGWGGLVVFVPASFVLLRRLFVGGVLVTIDERGVEDIRLRIGTIPWQDILAVRVYSYRDQHYLSVELADQEKYRRMMPLHVRLLTRANAWWGFPLIAINFAGLDPGIDDALEFVARRGEPRRINPWLSGDVEGA